MMEENKDINIALLIDVDNISSKYIGSIISELSKYGKITIRHMYGDWTQDRLRPWMRCSAPYSLTPVMQPNNTPGKNSSDIGLIIDAMDILYGGAVQGFCIVSSDGDFNKLATRLREAGKVVIGMGETKTPESFRQSCERFIFLDVIQGQDNDEEDEPAAPAPKKEKKKAAAKKEKDKEKASKGTKGKKSAARQASAAASTAAAGAGTAGTDNSAGNGNGSSTVSAGNGAGSGYAAGAVSSRSGDSGGDDYTSAAESAAAGVPADGAASRSLQAAHVAETAAVYGAGRRAGGSFMGFAPVPGSAETSNSDNSTASSYRSSNGNDEMDDNFDDQNDRDADVDDDDNDDNETGDSQGTFTDQKTIENAIVKMITDNAADGKETGLGEIGSRLVKIYPDFDIRNYHYTKLSEFLKDLPSLQVTNRDNSVWISLKSTSDSEIEKQILAIFASHNTDDMNIGQLKQELQERNPNLDATIRKSGVTRFSVYLNRNIHSVEVNGRHVTLVKR